MENDKDIKGLLKGIVNGDFGSGIVEWCIEHGVITPEELFMEEINEEYKEQSGIRFTDVPDEKKFWLFWNNENGIQTFHSSISKEEAIEIIKNGDEEISEDFIITDYDLNVVYETRYSPNIKESVYDNAYFVGHRLVDLDEKGAYDYPEYYEVDKVTNYEVGETCWADTIDDKDGNEIPKEEVNKRIKEFRNEHANNKEKALRIFSQDSKYTEERGAELEYLSEELKDDIEVVLTAIGNDPYAYMYASDRLQKNEAVIALVEEKYKGFSNSFIPKETVMNKIEEIRNNGDNELKKLMETDEKLDSAIVTAEKVINSLEKGNVK